MKLCFPQFQPFPAMAQFAVVRVPANFSADDDQCNCVPDIDQGKCFTVTPAKKKKSEGGPTPAEAKNRWAAAGIAFLAFHFK